MKKAFSLLLAIVLVLSMFSPAAFAATNPFKDVTSDAYYYKPVLWAVEKGITTGTSTTTFSPGSDCTRAQVVTFLWRAEGKPAPTSTNNPFTDVASGAYYYDAVLWAVENGITTGTSPTTFGPEDKCTRAHVATFLWRTEGKPAPTSSNPFTDVPSGQWFSEAVLWAVGAGVTNGMGPTTFAPNSVCSRGQIVTFLYRAAGSPEVEAPEEPTPSEPAPSEPETPPASEPRVYTYTGSGDQIVTGINLPAGDFYAEYVYRGKSNFIVRLYYGSSKYDYTSIANEIGNCTGQVYLDDTRNKAYSGCYLDVQATGDWTIRIVEVTSRTTTNIAGTGKIVTGMFTARGGQTVIKLTHNGSRNFIVHVWEVGGGKYDYDSLTNEIGAYSGQKLVTLTAGKDYFFSVNADGNWTIDLGLGDSVTYYKQPTIPEAPTEPTDPSDPTDPADPSDPTDPADPDEPEKFTYSEVYDLDEYAEKANDVALDAMDYISKAYGYGEPTMKAAYLKMAQRSFESVVRYMDSCLSILEGKVTIEIYGSDFATLEELVQHIRDEAQKLVDLEITADNASAIISDFQDDAMDVGLQCLTLYKVTQDMVSKLN